jgi:putative solute:sodium symporter small subunit
MVLGKNIVLKDDHRAVLSSGLTFVVQGIRGESMAGDITPAEAKILLELEDTGFDKIMTDLLPLALAPGSVFSQADAAKLPEIMALYLTHNESFLTRARFMGFPFHYWYTAQFLLILFVVLCIIYAVSLDRLNAKFGLIEDSHNEELGA